MLDPCSPPESFKHGQDEYVKVVTALAKGKWARKTIQSYCAKGQRMQLSLNCTEKDGGRAFANEEAPGGRGKP